MTEAPELLLAHPLKTLRLPNFLRAYDKQARLAVAEGVDHLRYLARLTGRELRILRTVLVWLGSLDHADAAGLRSQTRRDK